jgi:hypothetical protein
MEPQVDIFRMEADGQMMWLGAAESLGEAKARVQEFAKSWAADYMIVNLKSGLKLTISASAATSPHEPASQVSLEPEC